MATCNECLHRGPCGAKGGILKDFSTGNLRQDVEIRCGHFKNKSQYVEVVRCKDCAFSREMYASEKKIFMQDCVGCTHLSMAGHAVIMSADGFCSYGERRPFK